MTSTKALRQLADREVHVALNSALDRVAILAALKQPHAHFDATLRAYLGAVRARLEWMERGGGSQRRTAIAR